MSRKLLVAMAVLALILAGAMPAAAITGGQPDGDRHPFGALLLAPGVTLCSGTLIAPNVILTAGHCTSLWTSLHVPAVLVTFEPVALNPATGQPAGTWYLARSWATHPDYVAAAWPFTRDYGLLFLDNRVAITPAQLPAEGALADMIGTTGQTDLRFQDVGYGQDGVNVGGGPPVPNFDFIRKVSTQRYNPSQGAHGALDPGWLILGNTPSDQHGGACPGDSGSGIFPTDGTADGTTIVAVHTGGYSMGFQDRLCARSTSLNHRVDLPDVLAWINDNLAD